MKKVGLVNIKKIKQHTLLGDNSDEKIITGALLEVQDLELEPLIGTTYINKLYDGVIENNLSDDDKLVLNEVIEPFLIYGAMVASIIPLHYKLADKGLNKSTDGTLKLADGSDLSQFTKHYQQRFDAYKKRLIEYFKTDGNDETNTSNDESTTTSILNFYMPDAIDKSRDYEKARANKMNY